MLELNEICDWLEEYYKIEDRDKRLSLLKQQEGDTAAFAMELWNWRYKQRQANHQGVDYSIRAIVEILFADRKRKGRIQLFKNTGLKQLEEAIHDMGLDKKAKPDSMEECLMYHELRHAIRLYIRLCYEDKNYSTGIFRFNKLKIDKLETKIVQELYGIAILTPQHYNLKNEFALLTKAVKDECFACIESGKTIWEQCKV